MIKAILLLLCIFPTAIDAGVECTETAECEVIFRLGSECINGECSNPFYKEGCLKKLVPGWDKIRICNSEDGPDAIEQGICRGPNLGLEYPEIRILGQNWESAFFQAWLLQILLSEVLDVPATVETGEVGKTLNFYDPNNGLDYAVGYDFDALRRGNAVGDCTRLRAGGGDEEYQSCAHVIPEIWSGQKSKVAILEETEVIEPRRNVGLLGHQGFFIPRFAGVRDPKLLTFFGLRGEENRRKMAETFLRPTSWKQYCELVSTDNCTTPTNVTSRPPAVDSENDRMFVEGEYAGYFRKTDDHDCDKNPDTCHGDVVDYPCGWTSYTLQQFHHLNIALKSHGDEPITGGYTYAQMTEIWAAANATGSDVMMRWWTPEALYQTFLTTEAEFQRVSFPPPTQDCVEARVTPEVRCEGTLEERLGDPKGVCDDPSHSLLRLITKSLREASMDPSIPAETRSPGYDMVSSLTLSELQIGKIFDYWLKRGSDKWNFDPRDAACRWLSENLHVVKPMIPKTYPRIIRENEDYYDEPLFYVSLFFAMAATVLVFAMMACVHYNCKKPSVARAQVEFLWMLLWGLLMVATASVVLVIPATDASCTSVAWLADMGFTLSLVPLIVKMAAINTLMQAAKSMRRVVVKRERLFGVVFGLCFLVFGFLLTWTIMDPPRQSAEYEISDEVTGNDETVVIMSYHCESDSDVWRMATAGWNAILLLIATIFTFQTRKVRREINETQSLIFLIYSHCIFVALRCILFSLEGVLSPWNVTRYLSLIYSIDTISACCIYFAPKVLAQEELTMEQRLASSRRSRFSETRPSALSKMHSYNRNGSSFARDQNGSVTESPLHDDTTDSDSPVDHDNTDSEAHLDCIVESDSEKEEAEESTDGSQSQPVAFDFLT